eukprot:scaffold105082_cov30-Tisochrysis_lutea.AAC.2
MGQERFLCPRSSQSCRHPRASAAASAGAVAALLHPVDGHPPPVPRAALPAVVAAALPSSAVAPSVRTRSVSSYELIAQSRRRAACWPRQPTSGESSTCEMGRGGSPTACWRTQLPVRKSHALSTPRLSPLSSNCSAV